MKKIPLFAAQTVSRRHFIRNAGIVAGAAFAFPTIIPARVLGLNGAVSPSNKITMGVLGMAQGYFNAARFLEMPDVEVVAICDVDTARREKGVKQTNEKYGKTGTRGYNDYRDMFASGIDTVILGSPDHTHGILSVAAARAGIDIFGEKPLAHTLAEGRAICKAVRENNVVWQTGSWQRSIGTFRRAAELVVNGRLGKIGRIEITMPGKFYGGRITAPERKGPATVPAGLDYELWVGPAQWSEYDPRIVHHEWRYNLKYGGGALMDWVGHHVDIAHWAMGLDNTGPVKISGTGTYGADGVWDAEYEYGCTCDYADGLVMTLNSLPSGLGGTKFIGEKGWVDIGRGYLRASDPKILLQTPRDDEKQVYCSDDHWRNFIDCVKDRRTSITPCEAAHRSASVGHLSHIAMRTGRTIHWDPATETIRNDAAASEMLTPKFRAPWKFSDIA